MLKRILLAYFLFVVISAQAQNPVLKKNVTGVQIGLLNLTLTMRLELRIKVF